MFEQLLKLLLEPLRGIIDHLVRLALADVQGYDVAVVAVAVDESEVVEEAEVLLRILQPFMEVEADNIVGNIVATRLHAVDDAAHALVLVAETEIAERNLEACGTEVLNHVQHHVAGKVGLEGKVLVLFERLGLLLLQLRGDGAAHPAVGPVRMFATQVEHQLVAVERLGADVERTEAALARAVRSGDNRKFWTTLHLLRNEIRVTAFAGSGGAAKNAVGATAAVESNAVFTAVGIGQISVSVVIEERHGNATAPRIGIDALYLTARRTIGFAGRLAVWQLDNINVFICAHNRFPLSFDGAKLQLFCE